MSVVLITYNQESSHTGLLRLFEGVVLCACPFSQQVMHFQLIFIHMRCTVEASALRIRLFTFKLLLFSVLIVAALAVAFLFLLFYFGFQFRVCE